MAPAHTAFPCALWTAAACTAASAPAPPRVTTPALGVVEGVVEGDVDVFRGLRYGLAARFEPPQPFTAGNTSVYDGTTFGAWCYGDGSEVEAPASGFSEDCLFLNVWRPRRPASSAALPVLFYVHGGGFTTGGGADPLFDGARLAAATRAVVVTINYRLGPLGFLVTDWSGRGGMHGIADAVLALKWTAQNIRSLGGDESRVTVFGESAGGCAACILAVSPAAAGLLKHAIVESGPCVGEWGPAGPAEGMLLAKALMARHLKTSVEGLKEVAPDKLLWPLPTQGYFFDDGLILAVDPLTVLEQGRGNVATLAIGGNSFDGTSELLPHPAFPSTNATVEQYLASLRLYYSAGPAHADAVAAQYLLERFGGNAQAAFVAADSDRVVTCPSLRVARAAATAGGRVHAYNFSHHQDQCDLATMVGVQVSKDWASHASELVFVFGNVDFVNPLNGSALHCNLTEPELRLSSRVQSLWGSLAATGTPLNDGVAWPRFTAETQELVLQLRTADAGALANPKHADCEFWDKMDGLLFTI